MGYSHDATTTTTLHYGDGVLRLMSSVGFSPNVALFANGQKVPFWSYQIREPPPHVPWDFMESRLLKGQLCRVFRLWLSGEKLILFKQWISPAFSELLQHLAKLTFKFMK